MGDINHIPAPRRHAAACPWCSDGTPLQLRGDGFGGMALWCTQCGCKGPTVPIAGEFDAADEAAIARWSTRPVKASVPPPDTIARVHRAIELQQLLCGGKLPDTMALPVQMRDLHHLLQASGSPLPQA